MVVPLRAKVQRDACLHVPQCTAFIIKIIQKNAIVPPYTTKQNYNDKRSCKVILLKMSNNNEKGENDPSVGISFDLSTRTQIEQ